MIRQLENIATVLTVTAAGQLIAFGDANAADTSIANINDSLDKHFEVASKYFGDGVVQMHSRQEGADGTRHVIYEFDCADQNYNTLHDDSAAPRAFPMNSDPNSSIPFDRNMDLAPLAQHACTKHGHPLLEW